MRIDIDRRLFAEAFGDVATVAPRTSPKPILQSVLVQATEDGVTLLATDLDVSIRRHVLGVEIIAPGSAVLPRDRMAAILAKTEDARLMIEHDGDTLCVLGESDEFRLATEDANLYPVIPDWPATGGSIEVAAVDLRALIRRTSYAADPESTRYALGGCLIETTDEDDRPTTIRFTATDGRRLAIQRCGAVAHDDFVMGSQRPVIGMKALKLIDRLNAEDDAPASLTFSDHAVMVRTERAEVFARLVEGRFPRCEDVLPTSPPAARFRVVAGKLAAAIERARITADVETNSVAFNFAPGCLSLSAAAQSGKSSVRLPIDYEGPKLARVFDPDYMLDALKSFPGDAELTVALTDASDPALITGDDGRFTYVIQSISR